MVQSSILQRAAIESPLKQASCLKPNGKKGKRNLIAELMLTSLVDALSILLIYLLMNFSNTGEILYLSKDMQLPGAKNIQPLERATIVKIESGQMYIENEPVSVDQLTQKLLDFKNKLVGTEKSINEASLTVQADKKTTYDQLSQIVHAGSQAGYSEVRFAVLAE